MAYFQHGNRFLPFDYTDDFLEAETMFERFKLFYPTGRPSINLTTSKTNSPINPLTAEWALRALTDFTLSNARRFYSSMGNPLDGKGLRKETPRMIVSQASPKSASKSIFIQASLFPCKKHDCMWAQMQLRNKHKTKPTTPRVIFRLLTVPSCEEGDFK